MDSPIVWRGHRLGITEALREYAGKKLAKMEKYLTKITKMMVEFDVREVKDPDKRQVVLVTVWARKHVFRAEEVSADMYASIDLAVDNIERQLRRYKEKLVDRHHDRTRRVDKAAKMGQPETEQ